MDELMKAWAAAWAECENPEMDSINPHFKNRFASPRATLKAIRKACQAHGIMYLQRMAIVDGRTELHSAVCGMGASIELSAFPIDMRGNSQQQGSALTYAKRQLAQMDWGIVGDDDDDGEAAVGRELPVRQPASQPTRKLDRNEMLEWIRKLRPACEAGGTKAEGIDSWLVARFGTADPDALGDEQIADYGKYLKGIIDSQRALARHA